MKVYGDISVDGEVTNLGQFKHNREEQKREELNAQLHQARLDFLDEITIAAISAIDNLTEKGMSRLGAINLVQDHLENLSQSIGKDVGFD